MNESLLIEFLNNLCYKLGIEIGEEVDTENPAEFIDFIEEKLKIN